MNKIIRNIIIVALFTVGGGWLGIWLNNITGNTMPPMQSLGALIWLTTPALSGILLRAIGGDGWKDSGFGLNLISGWKWYLIGILVYPLAALLTFGLGALLGIVSTDGFAAQGFGAYLSVAGTMFVGSTIGSGKNPPDNEPLHRQPAMDDLAFAVLLLLPRPRSSGKCPHDKHPCFSHHWLYCYVPHIHFVWRAQAIEQIGMACLHFA